MEAVQRGSPASRHAELGSRRNAEEMKRSLAAIRTITRADSAMRGAAEFSTCVSIARQNLDALAEVVKKAAAFVRAAEQRKQSGVLDDEAYAAEVVTPAFILSLSASLERVYSRAVEAGDSDALKCISAAATAVVNRVAMNQSILSPETYADEPAVRRMALQTRHERAMLLVAAVDLALHDVPARYSHGR